MVDSGLVDPLHRIGFEMDPVWYDQLKQAGQFQRFQYRDRRDASGRMVRTESGLISAQLIDPATQQPVGPVVAMYVSRGNVGIPSRVGLVFFHSLHGCNVIWDLGGRIWCIQYP
jgi:hypothetical protein